MNGGKLFVPLDMDQPPIFRTILCIQGQVISTKPTFRDEVRLLVHPNRRPFQSVAEEKFNALESKYESGEKQV